MNPTSSKHLVLAGFLISLASVAFNSIVGDRSDLVGAVHERYLPNTVLAWGEPYPSPLFEQRQQGLAYVCRNYACQRPTDDVDELVAQLPMPSVHDVV